MEFSTCPTLKINRDFLTLFILSSYGQLICISRFLSKTDFQYYFLKKERKGYENQCNN